jgi:predicted transcriptional regulator
VVVCPLADKGVVSVVSNLPRITVRLGSPFHEKFKVIAEKYDRHPNQQAKRVLTAYIKVYEERNGEIKLTD